MNYENFNLRQFLKPAIIFGFMIMLTSCFEEEELNVPVNTPDEINLENELDIFIEENFTQEFGMAIRYRFVDRFISPFERATPPREEIVRPMLDFIQTFWVEPYLEVENGEAFFRNHVPSEIVLLGSPLFNDDGTITLGTADAGAQITFTNVNALDMSDDFWIELQLQTVYHEFAHTVHQIYKLPPAFETISPAGYTSPGSWFNLPEEEALQRGFVSPYASSTPNEDFAETVAFFLFDDEFQEEFLTDEADCATEECVSRNEGRERIRQKLASISDHYLDVTGVNLEEVRNAVQAKL